MTFKQLDCDICTEFTPVHKILSGEELLEICRSCWEDMLQKAGDE